MGNKSNFTLVQKLRYHFDNLIGRGTPALITMLGIAFLISSFLSGVIVWATEIGEIRGKYPHFEEAIWSGLTHVIDPGTLGGDAEWHLRFGMLSGTIMGILILSALISIINAAFTAKIQELKQSRSLVIEKGHTVIMGWSDKVVQIISELMIAHENQRDSCIVILSDKSMDEMKRTIYKHIPKTGKTRLIFRYGNPRDTADIHIANINDAKSIIILAPEEAKSEAFVIKSILAIVKHPNRKVEKYTIIAEIRNESDKEIAQLAGGDEVTILVSNDVISKITVQTSRQTGLSLIYNDLVNFGNVEMYILPSKGIHGKTFKEVLLSFETTTLVGIKNKKGELIINPDSTTILDKDDQLLVIAEDDDELVVPSIKPYIEKYTFSSDRKNPRIKNKQSTLILGWNRNAITIIKELDNYILEGSEVLVVAEGEDILASIEELQHEVKNQTIQFKNANINSKKVLMKIALEQYDDCIILGYSDNYNAQEADAITIITLMYVREIVSSRNAHINIVSEIMDVKNRVLAQHYKVDDFIVSDLIISNILAQLSENKELQKVFDILFTAEGNEIYLKKISDYMSLDQPVLLYELYEKALSKKEILIGYRQMAFAEDAEKEFGIILNPSKSQRISFTKEDYVVVISED